MNCRQLCGDFRPRVTIPVTILGETLPFPLPDGDFRPRVTIPVTILIFRYHFRYPTGISASGNDSGYDFWKTLPFSLPDGVFPPRVTISVTILGKRYHFRYPAAFSTSTSKTGRDPGEPYQLFSVASYDSRKSSPFCTSVIDRPG